MKENEANRMKKWFDRSIAIYFKDGGTRVKASMCLMGLGQLMYGQIGKGLLYLAVLLLGIAYFVYRGGADLVGLFTLGTTEANTWLGVAGDNSVVMLLMGILSVIALLFLSTCYLSNVKDVYETQKKCERGGRPARFTEELKQLLDKKFYRTVLFLPILGICVFNILPIIFMIAIAFTNYGGSIVPPKLVDWVGLENFVQIATLSRFAPTFGKILVWNLLWAVLSTTLNYFAGLGLALLLNKGCVKGKAFWRAFPVLAYAVPGFITLLGFKFMFSYGGPINQVWGIRQSVFWTSMRSGRQGSSVFWSMHGSAYHPSCCWRPESCPIRIRPRWSRQKSTAPTHGSGSSILRCPLYCFPPRPC